MIIEKSDPEGLRFRFSGSLMYCLVFHWGRNHWMTIIGRFVPSARVLFRPFQAYFQKKNLKVFNCLISKSHSFRTNRRKCLQSDRSHRVRSFSRCSLLPGQRFLVVNLHISATGDVIDVVKSAAFRFRDYDQLFIVNLKLENRSRRRDFITTLTSPPPATCETLSNVPHLDLMPLQSDLLDLILTFPPFGVCFEFSKLPHFDLTFVRSSFWVVIFTLPPSKKDMRRKNRLKRNTRRVGSILKTSYSWRRGDLQRLVDDFLSSTAFLKFIIFKNYFENMEECMYAVLILIKTVWWLTWSMFFIVKTSNFRLCFNLQFLRLNLDISATRSMSNIFHTSNLGPHTGEADPK